MRRASQLLSFFLLLYSLTPKIQAQSAGRDSSVTAAATAGAIQQYHDYLAPETALYRGSQYVDYGFQLEEGHPFFDTAQMRKGSLVYNGIFYKDILLMYDLVRESLVINDPYNSFKIAIVIDEVDSFTIGRHIFIRLKDTLTPTAPRPALYEQLYKGRSWLLKRERKTIQEQSSSLGFTRFIDHTTSYYLKKGSVYHTVNNKRSLLNALKDKSKELRKFLRKNSLNLKEDKDNTLIKAITWYDSFSQ